MSENEPEREEPSVLPGREAMKLIGNEPEEPDSAGDESEEAPSVADRKPEEES